MLQLAAGYRLMIKFSMFKNKLEAEIADARMGQTRNGYENLLNGNNSNTKYKTGGPMAARSKA